MEMTGSFDLDKPVLLAAVVACGFSRQFGLNIYDSGAFRVFADGIAPRLCGPAERGTCTSPFSSAGDQYVYAGTEMKRLSRLVASASDK